MAPPVFVQHMLRCIFVVAFFALIFYMYFKPSFNWSESLLPSIAFTDKVNEAFVTGSVKNVTVLVWLWPFGKRSNLANCSALLNIEGCFITADRNLYNQSDGILIHHRDISGDLSNLPKQQRPHFQKWVWFNMESPTHSWKNPRLTNLFNLTANYRRDADVKTPYGFLLAEKAKEDFVPPSKDKLVCWIVSNWNPNHNRVKYYNELKKHVEVHVYGNAFKGRISGADYLPTLASCKFYLSFENSIHKDYITEKLYNPLSVGTVPVVLGPPRENYENFIPQDAFIHVDDFPSPKELADYLQQLDKNMSMYHRYFDWRRHFKVKGTRFLSDHACLACDYIRRHTQYQTIDVDQWFWG
ncbi:4-galactosyl-N-acetylglucosaminide 3-alpha-L-fucosyltransferase 9-like [Cololabis saira]|uniref:4-galactosyl-N-acetylglucosaminide 3-alpha-L-fucosyltransferase 9-like n=1 Tax=Cololabis saira TaxID=129043 RepID=UPI002AD496D2|nr:4-galactosyl-N-acetylglucosaminide 3-alpha-L-fucosyltransferase 9-like [Cololabis saira]XP_061599586.1 4-galactosyl-N-acetylglucosaminide 3-alpha-L-fucosyltransferase 9-like [Cololabis saira]XP_061599587.1 4-galactosyl-N-acetylglucosaminide 3-alpha-L-fucosyltransferase 9-like [Cololabis saira]